MREEVEEREEQEVGWKGGRIQERRGRGEIDGK